MSEDKRAASRSQSCAEPTPTKGLPNLSRYLSLAGGFGSPTTKQNLSVPRESEEDLSSSPESVRGPNSGSMTRPLADSPTNNLERENQLQGIKRALARASSIAANRMSLKAKPPVPGPVDLNRSWQGMEHFLRQRAMNADPETVTPNRKPFHQRTWFASTIYGTLMALMVAAILALACTRSVVMPRMVLRGEIVASSSSPQDSPVASPLLQNTAPQEETTTPSPNPASRDGPTLLGLLDTATTWTGAPSTTPAPEPSSTTPAETTPSPSMEQRRRNWTFILSLTGPLQRFSVRNGSR